MCGGVRTQAGLHRCAQTVLRERWHDDKGNRQTLGPAADRESCVALRSAICNTDKRLCTRHCGCVYVCARARVCVFSNEVRKNQYQTPGIKCMLEAANNVIISRPAVALLWTQSERMTRARRGSRSSPAARSVSGWDRLGRTLYGSYAPRFDGNDHHYYTTGRHEEPAPYSEDTRDTRTRNTMS